MAQVQVSDPASRVAEVPADASGMTVPSGFSGSARVGDGTGVTGAVESVTVTVRYFAAARAAADTDEEPLEIAAPATVASVLAAAVSAHGAELARVLERCSYLRNSVAVHGLATELVDGDAVDVLPPFAGG